VSVNRPGTSDSAVHPEPVTSTGTDVSVNRPGTSDSAVHPEPVTGTGTDVFVPEPVEIYPESSVNGDSVSDGGTKGRPSTSESTVQLLKVEQLESETETGSNANENTAIDPSHNPVQVHPEPVAPVEKVSIMHHTPHDPPPVVVNVPSYMFISNRIAQKYTQLFESILVLSYETYMPTVELSQAWKRLSKVEEEEEEEATALAEEAAAVAEAAALVEANRPPPVELSLDYADKVEEHLIEENNWGDYSDDSEDPDHEHIYTNWGLGMDSSDEENSSVGMGSESELELELGTSQNDLRLEEPVSNNTPLQVLIPQGSQGNGGFNTSISVQENGVMAPTTTNAIEIDPEIGLVGIRERVRASMGIRGTPTLTIRRGLRNAFRSLFYYYDSYHLFVWQTNQDIPTASNDTGDPVEVEGRDDNNATVQLATKLLEKKRALRRVKGVRWDNGWEKEEEIEKK